jgi:GNAT superfamily N-acetyltransferase
MTVAACADLDIDQSRPSSQALVVDEVARGSGAGRRLMETAGRWAGQRGFASVALASHIARSGAHAFYKRLGYRIEPRRT